LSERKLYDEIKSIIVSENIILKQIELSDSDDIFSAIDNQREYLGKWLPFVETTRVVDDTKGFIRSMLEPEIESREYTFVIHFNGDFAGLIGFKGTDRQNKKTEIGYWLSEKYQKKGIVFESVKALLNFAFNELEMNRVQIKCATGNIPSRNIPLRLGFRFEGIERDGELLAGGVFTDIEVYSLLKND
jgi:ribosomal-protein-serine acetyltransferase